ncbi:hypothetical protein [Rhodohalobacter sp.]|uniref:hypothetical protein n=1 Tax=Rhodohalobacter sp. TaxID=1974210 RepID=UPI002ACEE9E4|nr:hypothetical protein [Rhodohalobacter sp.]MDZ7755376.1 hypothetical protein [Rhodohalobacter sp.]
MHIQKLMNLVLFSLMISCITPAYLSAQSEKEKNEEEDPIILSPAVDRQVYQSTSSRDFSSLNGLIVGNRVFGVETIFRQPGARADLGFSFTAFYDADDSATRDGNFLIGALSVGRTIPISEYTNSAGQKKIELYFRVAPGFGFAAMGIFENESSQFFPGVTATTEFGAIYHFTDKFSFFTNAGGRYYWFPGLDEMGLLGRPAVMLGLQFNISGGLRMINF